MVSYDKNSFLSGVAVGRQLKGWATATEIKQDDTTIWGVLGYPDGYVLAIPEMVIEIVPD